MPARPHDRAVTAVSAGSKAGPPATGRYLLIVGADLIVTRSLPPRGAITLGREADADVELPGASISRRHARVIVHDDEVQIEDLGSTNGIKLGGERIERGRPTRLPLGEGVRLGPYTLIVLSGTGGAAVSRDGHPCAALVIHDPTLAGKTELVERVARHGVNILIQGETGTGKEVLAQSLHTLSGRPGALVAINCAALTGPLLESELFGHERGAFTGATRTKLGLLEVAGSGTALLDEIGDLPLELQGKLLRAIESRQVYRVGGTQPIELRARLIAATHRDLPDLVARGGFRQDLYFRVNGITLAVPPLRERRGAIAALADRFLGDAARAAGAAAPRIAPAALAALVAHDWPGNVRELRSVLERALLLAGPGPIERSHVLLSPARRPEPSQPEPEPEPEPELDRARFLAVAQAHAGNTTAIGRALHTSRSHVRRLAQRFGVDLEGLRRDPPA
jgi:two-component system, NtrC family, response regulator AtoC